MLTLIHKGNLFNVPIEADADGMFLKLKELKSPPKFKTLSELVQFYAAKKQKCMPCKLNTNKIDEALRTQNDALDE